MPTQRELAVPTLGPCALESPLQSMGRMFADESIRVRVKRHIHGEAREIDILFCIGGDSTQRGAHCIQLEIAKRGLPESVVGIPKTIDNDVPILTAVAKKRMSLESDLGNAVLSSTRQPNWR